MKLYTDEFNGSLPENLEELMANEKMNPGAFICWFTNDTDATQPSYLLTAGHCSYVYLGTGLTQTTVKPTDVLMYEPPANHGHGYQILFGDHHVEQVDTARGTPMVAAAEAAMKLRLQSRPTTRGR